MEIEKYFIDKDISVICMQAESFPNGVLKAHQKLHEMLDEKRNYFAISSPNSNGSIVYKACAEESYSGEGKELNCETFVIQKGNYHSILIKDYKKDISMIQKAFETLLSTPKLDPKGYCLEMYLGEDLRCLVGILE